MISPRPVPSLGERSVKRHSTILLLALAAVSTSILAQQGPPGGGFGPPGFGPPGFGPPGGGPAAAMAMLGMPEVQSELKLSEEQKSAVQLISDNLQTSIRAIFEGLANPSAGEPVTEGAARFEQIGRKIEGAATKADDSVRIVLDAEQNSRYSQLRLQREGSGALLRDDVARTLGLDDDQVRKIGDALAGNHPFASQEERAAIDKESIARLTDDQRTKFSELKGAAFQFPPQGFGGPGGFGPPGMGGPGGMMGGERKLVEQFDTDANGWLNKDERTAARQSNQGAGGRRGFGPPGGFGGREEPVSPGVQITPESVTASDTPLYDAHTVRTLFLEFEGDDWESELEAFNNTDVEVPAILIADGKTYEQVGVHFRGMSSFGMVQAGHKRSLNVTLDFLNEDQKLHGYRTLNLLNSHEDASFLHTVLYFDVARNYVPAPQANFVRVVINGENWGLYVSAQQFNKEFVKDNFGSTKGTRWKVPGSPGGRGGLEYLGDDIAAYERTYSMKTSDGEKAWTKFITLCKTLNETPADQLEQALKPMLDIDEALWFLALENVLINSDGYWVRASDYCIFLDEHGRFHVLPHDANETFQPGMGPGMGGPGRGGFGGPGGGRGQRPPVEGDAGGGQPGSGRPGGPPADGQGRGRGGRGPGGMGGGVTLDPLVGLTDASKPLRSKLLAVPALKQRYLSFVRTIAEDWLDWQKLGPIVDGYAEVISPHVEADTRKLSSFAAFQAAVSSDAAPAPTPAGDQPAGGPGFGPPGRGGRLSLRQFADQRRAFLLEHAEVKAASRVDYKRDLTFPPSN